MEESATEPAEEQPIEEPTKSGLVCEPLNESCFRIQVFVKPLILASSVFKKMIPGGWKESLTYLQKGSVEITLPRYGITVSEERAVLLFLVPPGFGPPILTFMPLKIAVGSATITHRSCPFSRTCLGTRSKVVGIGTVDFPTKISPTQTGPSSHGVLHLKKVLHAPSIICNIIGQPLLDDCNVLTSFSESSLGSSGSITNLSDGRSVAYFNPLNRVGPKVGPPPFNSSEEYMIHAFWPESERQRFAALQASRQIPATASGPLTSAEKAWLKRHHRTEFNFLRVHGLSIFKDEDREEGRAILRAVMSNDGDEPGNCS
ncbi:hypothetical protein ETB97_002474 [Aspergillus alliaceus]|uniref:Uncharacterized protein n=1 Tax=Petromyces alliaceus TaxID=209559 RepID=A0A8H6A2N6_PETAA|nr:hypothetical protein ETB97_002474 [Aspergillus burnettii]